MPVVPKPRKICTEVPPRIRVNLIGRRFGELTVVGYGGRRTYGSGKAQHTVWLCRCSCGNWSEHSAGNLLAGHSRRCAECAKGMGGQKARKHGLAHTRVYATWMSLKSRGCLSKEWQDVRAFMKAVGEPRPGEEFIRPDPTRPAGPGNGLWADAALRSKLRHEQRARRFAELMGGGQELYERLCRVSRQRQYQLMWRQTGRCPKCGGEPLPGRTRCSRHAKGPAEAAGGAPARTTAKARHSKAALSAAKKGQPAADNEKREAIRMYKSGMSIKDVAQTLGRSESTVSAWLGAAGVKRKATRSTARRKKARKKR